MLLTRCHYGFWVGSGTHAESQTTVFGFAHVFDVHLWLRVGGQWRSGTSQFGSDIWSVPEQSFGASQRCKHQPCHCQWPIFNARDRSSSPPVSGSLGNCALGNLVISLLFCLLLKLSHGMWFRGWILPGHHEMFFPLWKRVRFLGLAQSASRKKWDHAFAMSFYSALRSNIWLWEQHVLRWNAHLPSFTNCLGSLQYIMTHILFQCWGSAPLRSHELWWWGRACDTGVPTDDFCHVFPIPTCSDYGTKVTVQLVLFFVLLTLCKH